MNIPLTKPIQTTATVEQSAQSSEVTLEWMLITPGKSEIRAKIQPLNIEIAIVGEQFDAIAERFYAGFTNEIAPLIQAALPASAFIQ